MRWRKSAFGLIRENKFLWHCAVSSDGEDITQPSGGDISSDGMEEGGDLLGQGLHTAIPHSVCEALDIVSTLVHPDQLF